MNDRRFWISHAGVPGVLFVTCLAVIELFDLDRALARSLFFDAATQHWLGEGEGAWWARELIHTHGRWLVRLVAAAALFAWIATFFVKRMRSWRRRAGFAFLAVALSTAIVGVLKVITNVDCPWDLTGFGGDRPFVYLFADRPDSLPHAACFPGAHSSSGFAMFFGYFLLRDRSRRQAALALLGAILVGVIFSIGQQARGAHFLSHDLTSAVIVWFVQLLLYARMLRTEKVTVSERPEPGK